MPAINETRMRNSYYSAVPLNHFTSSRRCFRKTVVDWRPARLKKGRSRLKQPANRGSLSSLFSWNCCLFSSSNGAHSLVTSLLRAHTHTRLNLFLYYPYSIRLRRKFMLLPVRRRSRPCVCNTKAAGTVPVACYTILPLVRARSVILPGILPLLRAMRVYVQCTRARVCKVYNTQWKPTSPVLKLGRAHDCVVVAYTCLQYTAAFSP